MKLLLFGRDFLVPKIPDPLVLKKAIIALNFFRVTNFYRRFNGIEVLHLTGVTLTDRSVIKDHIV